MSARTLGGRMILRKVQQSGLVVDFTKQDTHDPILTILKKWMIRCISRASVEQQFQADRTETYPHTFWRLVCAVWFFARPSLVLYLGTSFFWGCTFGRVYLDLPCIYSHDRWSYRRRFRLSLLCPLSVERYYFPLTSTWTQCALCFTRNMKSIALVPFYYPDFGQLSRLCIMSVCFDHSLMILILVLLHNEECPYEYYRPTSLTQETHTLTLPRTKHKRKNDWKSFHFHRKEKIHNC